MMVATGWVKVVGEDEYAEDCEKGDACMRMVVHTLDGKTGLIAVETTDSYPNGKVHTRSAKASITMLEKDGFILVGACNALVKKDRWMRIVMTLDPKKPKRRLFVFHNGSHTSTTTTYGTSRSFDIPLQKSDFVRCPTSSSSTSMTP